MRWRRQVDGLDEELMEVEYVYSIPPPSILQDL